MKVGDLVRCPNLGDLVSWFETTGIIIQKRGIEVRVLIPSRSFQKIWMRRDAVEVLNAASR